MTDLIGQLQAFDRQRGKDPIDPTRIEGFTPSDPPPPAQTVIPTARESYGEPVEVPAAAPPPSPLVSLGLEAVREAPVPVAGESPTPALMILDGMATYKGYAVTLTPEDQDKVASIVVKRVRAAMDEAYTKLTGTRPRMRVTKKGKKKS